MNTTKKLLAFMALMAVVLVSCEKDEEPEPEVMPPSNVAATVVVSTDNSGDVTVTPTADGASRFDLYWGDATTAPTTVNPGSSATHTYEEGDYTLRVVAVGSTGLTTEITKQVNVTFAAPANLAVNAAISETNLFEVTVTPTADNASMFDVDFGVEGADVQSILAGESATYEYAEAGDYTITVTAKGAGAATSEATESVSITGPTGSIELPIDFEDATVAYEFTDFAGNFASVVDNPDSNGNESAKVGSILKTAGSEDYAGSIITLGSAIDFTQGNTFQMKAWSPKAGGKVKFKIDDSSSPPDQDGNPSVFYEVDQFSTVENGWETLTYNFSNIPEGNFDRIILFFDFGNPGDETTYYFDDIELVEGASKERPQLPLDFENSDTEDYTWGVFGGVDPAEVISNPNTNGNTSANVTAITKNEGALFYAGAKLTLNGGIDWSAGTTIKMDVWAPRVGTPILLKLEDSSSPPDEVGNPSVFAEVRVSSTQAGMWETLYFDMTAFGGFATTTSYDAVVVFPDFGTDGVVGGETYFVDNIEVTADGGGGGGGNDAPTTAAPTPTQDAADVISIFSDSYDNAVAGIDYNPNWSQSTQTTIETVEGNEVLKYANLNYQGTDWTSTPIDVSSKTTVHIDYWTADTSSFNFYIISSGPQEKAYNIAPTAGEWGSVDIPLSHFDNVNLADLIQMKVGEGSGTLYLDNIYFYGDNNGGGGGGGNDAPTTAAPTPTQDAADVISIFSDSYDNAVAGIDYNPNWSQSTQTTIETVEGNEVLKYANLNYQGTDWTSTPIDVSSKTTVHIDYWTADTSSFNFYIISSGPQEKAYNIAPTAGEWGSVDIPLSHFDNVNLADLIQMKVGEGSGTLYLDNIYFYGDNNGGGGGGGNDAPTTAAPTPTQDAADVISIFSDSYDNAVAGIDYNPNWSQSTQTTIETVEGNEVLKYANLNYQGTDWTSTPIDVSSKTTVHIDYWTADTSSFNFYIISSGPQEKAYNIAPTAGEWGSVDIPLSHFDNVNLADLIQMKVGEGSGTLYLDNIYFY